MVVQRGTLKVLEHSVYMVLSLPASAFRFADENGDNQLSLSEFTQHRSDLISAVAKHVRLDNESGQLPLTPASRVVKLRFN